MTKPVNDKVAEQQIARAEQCVREQVQFAERSRDETTLYGPRKVGGLVTTTADGFELHLDYIARGPDNKKETDFTWSKDGMRSAMWTLDNKWFTDNEIIAWASEVAKEEGVPDDMSVFTWMPATAVIVPRTHAHILNGDVGDNVSILSVGKKTILGVDVRICANDDGTLQIDRIEVPVVQRRKGLAAAVLKLLVHEAKLSGIGLSACVCPDSKDFAVTKGLRGAFHKAGFLPLGMDGEVYLDDVDYDPHRQIAMEYAIGDMDGVDDELTYMGEIVDIVEDTELVVQHVGRGFYIAHNKTRLSQAVAIGDIATISYNGNWVGKVQVEKAQQKAVER
jgi:hypothetical protein